MILPVHGRDVLFAVASRPEIEGLCPGRAFDFWVPILLEPGVEIVLTGLGKANAAGAVARALDPGRHAGVVSIGVGGSLPGSGLEIAAVVAGSSSMFSDEGVRTPTEFIPAAALGFPPALEGQTVAGDAGWLGALESIGIGSVPIATVSVCSGSDALAGDLASRSGAAVEAMEGAAVGLVAARLGLSFCEVRAISNTTGDRAGQRWDLPGAIGALARSFARMRGSSPPD